MASYSNNLLLLTIVILSFPPAFLFISFNFAAVLLIKRWKTFPSSQLQLFRRRTILISGTAGIQGLSIARVLHKAGHRIVGADLQGLGFLDISKQSQALAKHYVLPEISAVQDSTSFSRRVVDIIKKEHVDVWIDCTQNISVDTIAEARRLVEDSTGCACISADINSRVHFKDKQVLLEFLRDRQLPVPEIHKVKSRGDIHNILNSSQGRKQYLLTSQQRTRAPLPKTLLPRRTLSQTYQDVSLLKISGESSFVLEEQLDYSTVYSCTSIVIRGKVKAFWVRRVSDKSDRDLPNDSVLQQAFRSYTEAVAGEMGPDFSSHLTISFVLSQKVSAAGVVYQILPVEGTLKLHPGFVPSTSQPESNDLAKIYMSILQGDRNGVATVGKELTPKSTAVVSGSHAARESYNLLEVIDEQLLEPCKDFMLLRISLRDMLGSIGALLLKVSQGCDAYYEFWDPLPAFWQYTVVFIWATLVNT